MSPIDGRQYTFHDKSGSRPPAYAIGERVPVLYDPDRNLIDVTSLRPSQF